MGRIRRASMAAAVAVLLSACCCSCAGGACAGGAQFPPSLWFDASPWTTAHPGASVTICAASDCKTANAAADLLQLVVSGDESTSHPLTVTSEDHASKLDIHSRFVLHEFTSDSACGRITQWASDARLDARGRLHLWAGTGGPFVPQVLPTAPTSTEPTTPAG